jgi:outer membrane receptor protein involved in Fe transport
MDAYADLNLGVEYRYSKNVSAFINFNNILNNKYERWYRYPVYGFNMLGGLTLTF